MCACWEALHVNFWSGSCNEEDAMDFTGAARSESDNPSVISEAPLVQQMSSCSNGESNSSRPYLENSLQESSTVQVFKYNELKVATRNFRPNNALGEGGFGTVYKGWIEDIGPKGVKLASSITVAVKVLNQKGLQGHKEWLAEVNVLGQLQHPHLVRLIGYCCEKEHRLLVYEYMPLGSLENHLFQKVALPLSWPARMKIVYGAAKGLAFLHGTEKAIIYRDFKSSNILLESDYTAKLSDFGLAKNGPEGDQTHISTRVMGTHGYAAPEYVMTGHLTARSDVYGFGVVLVELLTGHRAIDKTRPSGEHNLVEWARPYLRDKRKFLQIIDPKLDGIYPVIEAHKAATLASHCLRKNPKARPLMSSVVEALEPLQYVRDTSAISYTSLQGSSTLASLQNETGA